RVVPCLLDQPCAVATRALPPSPTRRSSDLLDRSREARLAATGVHRSSARRPQRVHSDRIRCCQGGLPGTGSRDDSAGRRVAVYSRDRDRPSTARAYAPASSPAYSRSSGCGSLLGSGRTASWFGATAWAPQTGGSDPGDSHVVVSWLHLPPELRR